jgi:hypothetical protein
MSASQTKRSRIIVGFFFSVLVAQSLHAQFLGSSEGFESPPLTLSSTWAGGAATAANDLYNYTQTNNWNDFYYFDKGVRVVNSGQGVGGSNHYLYIPIDVCSSPHFVGLQTNQDYVLSVFAASGSSTSAGLVMEFASSATNLDFISFTAGGQMLQGFSDGAGSPTTSGATLANSDMIQWNLAGNPNYSTSALDSSGIPWQQYSLTFKYTGTGGTLDFNLSAADAAGTANGGTSMPVVIDGLAISPVPEPGSMFFIGCAFTVFRFRRRRA